MTSFQDWIPALLDRSSEELDPNDVDSDWTGALEAARRGPEKRELAARQLAETGCDPQFEAELEQASSNEACAAALYYFGYDSAIVARMLANPKTQSMMLQAMTAVGVPFRGPVRIPARVIAPLLVSANAQAAMALMTELVDFSEPAGPIIGEVAASDRRLQVFAALSGHDWQRLTELLDSSTSDEEVRDVVKLLLPSQILKMPDSRALARVVLEDELAAVRRDLLKAGDLAPKLISDPGSATAIIDALFHKRFELASPPPYDSSNAKRAQAVVRLFEANPAVFAQALGTDSQRRRMLWDLFVQGFGYEEGIRRGYQLDLALGLPIPKTAAVKRKKQSKLP